MTRDDVISRIKTAEPDMRALGVDALYLYGSYARDEAHLESDIDILVDFVADRGAGLQNLMAPYHILEDCFPGIDIGYGTRDTLVPHYRSAIEQTALRIF